MENTEIVYRATVVTTNMNSGSLITDVVKVKRKAKNIMDFITIVSAIYSDCDECIITGIELVSKYDFTFKYIRGERVL